MYKGYKTVVFDLDGTLLDTLQDLYTSVNAALTAYGLPKRTVDEVQSFVGNGIAKLIERAIGGKNHPDFEGVLSVFKKHYALHCKDQTKPYDGVLELLQALQSAGVKTAVVSNKADFAVKLLAEEYFGGLLLDAVGENEACGVRKKPAPDSLFAVMDKLNAPKHEVVYVGDSEVDIQTAQNAGVDCISVTWGFKDREFLLSNGGTVLVDKPAEILQFCIEK